MATGHFPLPEFYPLHGIRLGVTSAGIKGENNDLTLFEISDQTTVGAVFTRNAFCAAPVVLSKAHIAEAQPAYLLINTGNANAGLGESGIRAANECVEALSAHLDVSVNRILPFSTGVIGEPLPAEKIVKALPAVIENLSEAGWKEAASAIMTTDTRPKGVVRELTIDGTTIHLNGICKGAGMIQPNMATMLGYVATDLKLDEATCQSLLKAATDLSFNCISVDGDTSTNDAVVLMATGDSGLDFHALTEMQQMTVKEWLIAAFIDLAQLIIRDAEGATKFVEIQVAAAKNPDECRALGLGIAHSPLVKTALFASDPNWGRILAVVGRVGIEQLDIEKVEIDISGEPLVRRGQKVDTFTEKLGQALFSREDITIRINLHRGDACLRFWTSDLSHDYVTINAEYRT